MILKLHHSYYHSSFNFESSLFVWLIPFDLGVDGRKRSGLSR
jgi:hypothetical protein